MAPLRLDRFIQICFSHLAESQKQYFIPYHGGAAQHSHLFHTDKNFSPLSIMSTKKITGIMELN